MGPPWQPAAGIIKGACNGHEHMRAGGCAGKPKPNKVLPGMEFIPAGIGGLFCQYSKFGSGIEVRFMFRFSSPVCDWAGLVSAGGVISLVRVSFQLLGVKLPPVVVVGGTVVFDFSVLPAPPPNGTRAML